MMIKKLSEFIVEQEGIQRSKEISKDEWLKIYKDNCDFEPGKTTELFRGLPYKTNSDFMFIDPSAKNLKDSYNQNYFNWILNLSKEWENYPRRNNALFMSTNYEYASSFTHSFVGGNTFLVIPFKNNNLGVCSTIDFWDNVNIGKYINVDIKRTPQYIHSIIEQILSFVDLYPGDDFNKFKVIINNIDKPIYKNEILSSIDFFTDSSKSSFLKGWGETNLNFVEYVAKLNSPKKLGVSLKKHNRNFKADKSVEVYTDQPCLLIRDSTYRLMINEL